MKYEYWRDLFTRCPSPFPGVVNTESEELVSLISTTQIKEAIRMLKDGAPGMDGMKKERIQLIGTNNIRLNIYIMLGVVPTTFKVGSTTLIPKVDKPVNPSLFRPITVSPIITRLLHKILAKNLEVKINLDPRQKAFRRRDGMAENLLLIRNIVDDHKRRLKPLVVE